MTKSSQTGRWHYQMFDYRAHYESHSSVSVYFLRVVQFLEPCRHFKTSIEPYHEIMALFVLRKLILQTHMRSHPVGLDVWFFGRTIRLLSYFMCANSDETVRMRRLAWAFAGRPAGRLCEKHHNLMSWLNFSFCESWIFFELLAYKVARSF